MAFFSLLYHYLHVEKSTLSSKLNQLSPVREVFGRGPSAILIWKIIRLPSACGCVMYGALTTDRGPAVSTRGGGMDGVRKRAAKGQVLNYKILIIADDA